MLAEEVVMDASELSTSRENKSSKSLATAGGFLQPAVCCHRHLCLSALLQIESHPEAQAAQACSKDRILRGAVCLPDSALLTHADGRSSKKLARHREDGAALNGAREGALPPELDLEAQAVEGGSRKGMILPFIRLAITFRDIHYYVAMPEVLSLSFRSSGLPAKNGSAEMALSCPHLGRP